MDRFLFSIDWEDHYEGLHQLILLKVTSDHFPILLQVGEILYAKRPFKFKNVRREVEGFSDLVKSF